MKTLTKKLGFIVAGVAVVVLGVGAGSAAGAAINPTSTAPIPVVEYKTNDSGETYGSAVGVVDPENEPDLIQAVATNGREGYVRKTDLVEPAPASPEEASQLRATLGRAIPVYSSDGKSVVGEFVIQPGQGSVAKG